jgi:hypothetical protein
MVVGDRGGLGKNNQGQNLSERGVLALSKLAFYKWGPLLTPLARGCDDLM